MTITIYDDYLVHANQTLTVEVSSGETGFLFDHVEQTDLAFTNLGRVDISSDTADRLVGFSESRYTYGLRDIISNRAGGEMRVSGAYNAVGFDIQDAVAVFRNDGLVVVTAATGEADGALLGYGASLTNTGHMLVVGQQALAIQCDYLAVGLNTGDIEARATGDATGVRTQSNDATFHNDGLISARSAHGQATAIDFNYIALLDNTGAIVAHGQDAVGVRLSPAYWAFSEIDNSGLIRADLAIAAFGSYGGSVRGVDIDNSGRIIGDIALNRGADHVLNTGVVKGTITLGTGKDVYDGSHGRLAGAVDAGGGDDELIGGAKADVLIGGRGADDLRGGAGSDTFAFFKASNSTALHSDLIHDLEAADWIDLSGIDADVTQKGDQAFVRVASLDGHAGEVALAYQPGDDLTLLQADVDGDGVADLVVRISGDHADFTGIVL